VTPLVACGRQDEPVGLVGVLGLVLPPRLGTEFRKNVAASWASNLADGLGLAAGPLLVASQTRDPFLVALAPMLQQLPWLLFGLLAGVVADRVDRRWLIVAGSIARGGLLAVLISFLATGHVSIGVVLVAVFLLGTCEVFVDTSSATIMPMLVDKPDLGIANARVFAGFITLNNLVGPPLGAALFAIGLVWPFAAQAVCVMAAAAIISRLRLPAHGVAREQRGRVGADLLEGLRWLWSSPPVRTLALVIVIFNITWGASWSVLVLYATDHLGTGPVGFALLATAAAVGGLVSTSAYGWLERHVRLGTLMKTCLTLEVLLHLGLALTTAPWVATLILFGYGGYAFVWGTLSTTVRQRAVPTGLQGRVGSAYRVGVYGGIVLGSLIGGLLARQWGILAPYWVGFVVTGAFLAVMWPQLKLIVHADERAVAQQ
jgi:MFS family permease